MRNPFRIDKSAFSTGSLRDIGEEEKAYWWSRHPNQRLEAIELQRQIVYAYDPAAARLQRVLEVAELKGD